MFKTVIKELFILILLSIAIVFALGILMYDYVPIGKVLPEEVKYVQPNEVASEINNRQNVSFDLYNNNITYEINGTDLNVYQKTNEYVNGKANPFEAYSNSVNQSTNTNTNTGKNTNTNTNTNTSDGTYFNSMNKK